MARAVSLLRRVVATLAVVTLLQSGTGHARTTAMTENAVDVGALRVSVAFSRDEGRRVIHAGTQADHFHVILENVSAAPFKIWRGREYLGYASLTFRLTDRKGGGVVVKRTPLPPGSETDMSMVLDPGERHVIDIHPRSSEWSEFPAAGEGIQKFSLQALYTSDLPKRDALGWTGRVTSPIYEIEWAQ